MKDRELEEIVNHINDLSNNYSQMDSYEAEHLLMARGVSRPQAQAIVKSVYGVGKINPMQNNVTPSAAAQFDLNILRTDTVAPGEGGTAITDVLPVVIFGKSQFASAYKAVIAEKIPAGITLVVTGGIGSTTPEDVLFTYTRTADGAISTIKVTCSQTAYTSMLGAMNTDMFKLKKVRYRINNLGVNNANTAQFTQEFKEVIKSVFGAESRNDIPVAASENPGDFKSNIVDINQDLDVDKDVCYRLGIIGVNGFQVTLSAFVQHFKKHNARGEFAGR